MKKILLLSLSALLFTGAFAQKGKNGNNGKGKQNKEYHQKKNRSNDGDYRTSNRDRDEQWDRNRNDDRYDNSNNNGKYSKNAPAKVREAFYDDYPNASNVSWTKDRGYWTAHFGGGLFNAGNRTATYKAKGQRVDNNSNGGIFGSRERTNNDTRNRTETRRRLPDIVNGN